MFASSITIEHNNFPLRYIPLLMRTSPCWIRAHHVLPDATSRLQLSCHVRFRFSRHPCTVSAISPSSGIETRRIRMRWKGDDDTIISVLVPAPEGSWIMLCDHEKVLRHLLGPFGPCIVSGLKPRLRTPPLVAPSTLGRPLGVKIQ